MPDQKGKKLADALFGQPEEQAAFGVFPQMKPRRSKQDPEAAKDVPRQLLRGWAAGTLGLPGDIEGLIRMLPGLDETPRLPTSEFYLDYLPGKAEGESGKAAAGLGTLFGGLGSTKIARGALEAGKGAQRLAERAAAMPSPTGLAAQRGVVKMPGGNWLTGSVERAVEPLKSRAAPANLGEMENRVALNKWINSNLTNYIKKQMATPDDPVRKLAEEGISHRPLTPYSYETAAKAGKKREVAGGGRYGKSQLAKQWEDESDVALNTPTVGQISLPIVVERNPWLKKLDPNERVYAVDNASELGFDHIVDVLREDLAAGRIRPEQLNKVSMEQAVRRTYEYDQEMAKKMAEAKIKATEGMPVYKEYPEGYKWIELKANKDLPPVDDGLGNMSSPGYTQLEDALKYEGETMGHCVGGYCDDVYEGRSRIYSLRDAKGEPHVTVEVNRDDPSPVSWLHDQPQSIVDEITAKVGERPTMSQMSKAVMSHPKYQQDAAASTPYISQIKGKQNRAPKEEYLPYVQDFVRSGQWSHVGDIRNTGLVRRMDLPHDERHLFPQDSDYITMEELRKLREGKDSGMKRGGAVRFTNNPDAMRLELEKPAIKPISKAIGGEITADDLIIEERPL